MATSSIFHNVVIDDPAKAEAFVAALEASETDPRRRPGRYQMTSHDQGKVRRLIEAWKREAH